jgi:[acyl-carrier-protein] S-malonyltransferase
MSFAFVFPGQGSQSIGMLRELAQAQAVVRETFAEASDVLGYDLWSIVTNGPEDRLNATEVTQPAMLTGGVAVWRAWRANGGMPPAQMAGHSLGEYSALVCADALPFGDAVRLVADRARYMQEAVPVGQGGMAAILGLDDEAVRALCAKAADGDVLEPVNFNSPGQVVIAGTAAAIACACLAGQRALALRLDGAGGGAHGNSPQIGRAARAVDTGDPQRQRAGRIGRRCDSRCIDAPGGCAGALGGNDRKNGRRGRTHRHRMWTR